MHYDTIDGLDVYIKEDDARERIFIFSLGTFYHTFLKNIFWYFFVSLFFGKCLVNAKSKREGFLCTRLDEEIASTMATHVRLKTGCFWLKKN